LLANQEFRLEATSEKTKYMVITCEQNAGRDYKVNTGNTCVEIV